MAYKIMLRMWWRIRDRNCALFLRLFIIYSCYLARVNNEKYIMNRSQLIAIASNAFYQYTHQHRQSGSIGANAHAHAHFPVFCACCSFQLCFALVFSPIMFNHFRAALFILSIFHSFATSALLSFYFFNFTHCRRSMFLVFFCCCISTIL